MGKFGLQGKIEDISGLEDSERELGKKGINRGKETMMPKNLLCFRKELLK